MVNKAKKGYKKEKMIRDQLEADGWNVVFKSVRFRFGCIDFANLFDAVAYKGKERLYISSKHMTNGDKHLQHQEEIKKFKELHGYEGEKYQLYLWADARWKGRGKNRIYHPSELIIVDL